MPVTCAFHGRLGCYTYCTCPDVNSTNLLHRNGWLRPRALPALRLLPCNNPDSNPPGLQQPAALVPGYGYLPMQHVTLARGSFYDLDALHRCLDAPRRGTFIDCS